MDLRLFLALILSFLPISELRGGLPLAVVYAMDKGIPIILIFSAVVMANILGFFLAFYFLDNVHTRLLRIKFYDRFFRKYVKKIQEKSDKFEEKYKTLGFLALAIFVAIPLPGTGAWTGALISWFLDLDRKKSLLFISLGVLAAGIIVLLGTLGFIRIFS